MSANRLSPTLRASIRVPTFDDLPKIPPWCTAPCRAPRVLHGHTGHPDVAGHQVCGLGPGHAVLDRCRRGDDLVHRPPALNGWSPQGCRDWRRAAGKRPRRVEGRVVGHRQHLTRLGVEDDRRDPLGPGSGLGGVDLTLDEPLDVGVERQAQRGSVDRGGDVARTARNDGAVRAAVERLRAVGTSGAPSPSTTRGRSDRCRRN